MRIKINGVELEASDEDIQRLLGLGKVQAQPSPVVIDSQLAEKVQVFTQPSTPAIAAKNAIELLKEVGFSLHTIVMVTRKILKIETTGKLLEDSWDRITTQSRDWFTRPIKDTFDILFASRITMPSGSAIAVIGLNSDNQMVILGIEHQDIYGTLNALRARGLRANSVKLAVLSLTPDFDDAFTKIFPHVKIQRDWGSVIDAAPVPIRDDVRSLMLQNSAADTIAGFKKSKAREYLEPHIESLITYFEMDRRLWRVLRALSNISRLEDEIRTKTKMAEGPDETKFLVTWAALRLQFHWIKIPVDSAQLSNLKYIKEQADAGVSSVRVSTQKGHIRRRPSVQKER